MLPQLIMYLPQAGVNNFSETCPCHVCCGLYSISPSTGSDVAVVAHLFSKGSSKSCAPSETAHTGSHTPTHKNKQCVHALKSCACVLTSLPKDGETKYSTLTNTWVNQFNSNILSIIIYIRLFGEAINLC